MRVYELHNLTLNMHVLVARDDWKFNQKLSFVGIPRTTYYIIHAALSYAQQQTCSKLTSNSTNG